MCLSPYLSILPPSFLNFPSPGQITRNLLFPPLLPLNPAMVSNFSGFFRCARFVVTSEHVEVETSHRREHAENMWCLPSWVWATSPFLSSIHSSENVLFNIWVAFHECMPCLFVAHLTKDMWMVCISWLLGMNSSKHGSICGSRTLSLEHILRSGAVGHMVDAFLACWRFSTQIISGWTSL